jgi:hypothetical protein
MEVPIFIFMSVLLILRGRCGQVAGGSSPLPGGL